MLIFFPIIYTSLYTGAYDDPNGSHISIVVVSELFEGKRPVQRQQLVYKALWEGTFARCIKRKDIILLWSKIAGFLLSLNASLSLLFFNT